MNRSQHNKIIETKDRPYENKFSLSIIMPVYNTEKYLSEAILSVLNQVVLPNELIIIDDGSTDQSTAIITELCHNKAFVKVVKTENRGLGPARNLGLEISNSKYIYFFDSDDIIPSIFVSKIKTAIETNNNPDIILFSGLSFYDDHTNENYPNYTKSFAGVYEGKDLIKHLVLHNNVKASACLYVSKKSIWIDGNFKFKTITHEDEEVFYPLISSANRSVVLKDYLFYRRIRSGSITTRLNLKKSAQGCLKTLETLHLFYLENKCHLKEIKCEWKKRQRVFFLRYLSKSIRSGDQINIKKLIFFFILLLNPRLTLTTFKHLIYLLFNKNIPQI